MTITIDPILQSLNNAIVHRPPYVSGTLPLPAEHVMLYYRTANSAQYISTLNPGDIYELQLDSVIDLLHATSEQLIALSEACDRATFGVNSEDVLDETYRKAGKMNTSHFSTPIVPERTEILQSIRDDLLEGDDSKRPIEVELYKLNVYDKGSFFKAHMDTPRSDSMFGSLVLFFPTPHAGGSLLLRLKDEEWIVDSANLCAEQSQSSVGFVSFFSDVEHEVKLIESGHRVTLTFNLYYGDIDTETSDNSPSISPTTTQQSDEPVTKELETLLADRTFLPEGGLVGFGLRHVYPVHNTLQHIPKLLKGSDATILRVAKALSLETQVYLFYNITDDDGNTKHLICPRVPHDVGNVHEVGLVWVLKDYYRGMFVYNDDDDDDVKIDKTIVWANSPSRTATNYVTDFIAYGNEAQADWVYGEMVLTICIPKASERIPDLADEECEEGDATVRQEDFSAY